MNGPKHCSQLLWLLGALPVLCTLINVSANVLRGAQQPAKVFVGYAVATGVSMALGAALAARLGIRGVAWSMLLSYGINALVMWAMCSRLCRVNSTPRARQTAAREATEDLTPLVSPFGRPVGEPCPSAA